MNVDKRKASGGTALEEIPRPEPCLNPALATVHLAAHTARPSRGRCAPDGFGYPTAMFFFFSNRLGCLGSLLLSAAVTVVLLLIFTR